MPRVFEEKGYVFHFYSADLDEPVHIHVRKAGKECKYWVDPIALADGGRFSDHELSQIERTIRNETGRILAAWQREAGKR